MTYTMLIVDDSRVSRLMIRTLVATQRPHWHFLEASNTQEAIDHAIRESIQLAAMDLNTSSIDGFEAARQLHALQDDTKIVLLTANVEQSVRERAQHAQLHFIGKPVTEQTVADMLAIAEG
ncbi:response regulator [Chitinibacter bivalviorum]|uniref:Response regulator n=1 Tax=Chitinibacter bivalviorum TaxID=2739434 RepID=A0A7H9BKX4_9NEIS|nr:response regulator [Chitinibacter bivalviorum]QLG88661.1 response regulator [Chitinibacter bivalviorum]